MMNPPLILITTYEVLCAFLNSSYHVNVVVRFNKINCFALYFFNIWGFLDFYFMAKYTFVRKCWSPEYFYSFKTIVNVHCKH